MMVEQKVRPEDMCGKRAELMQYAKLIDSEGFFIARAHNQSHLSLHMHSSLAHNQYQLRLRMLCSLAHNQSVKPVHVLLSRS